MGVRNIFHSNEAKTEPIEIAKNVNLEPAFKEGYSRPVGQQTPTALFSVLIILFRIRCRTALN